jgi:hypothetical protein
MRRVLRLKFVWALIAFLALLALQAFPLIGIFLMLFGAALFAGLLAHAVLILMFVEAATGAAPRILMLVPILAYGGYYVAYFEQGTEIARKSAELKATNPGRILNFTADAYSLVLPEAEQFVDSHAVPVVYEPNKNFQPERYVSHRLMTSEECNGVGIDAQNKIFALGVTFDGAFERGVCDLRFPERPPHKIVSIAKLGDQEIWKRKWTIGEDAIEASVDGAVIGRFRSASVWRLPSLPMFGIGCGLIDNPPSWSCGADFVRTSTAIAAIPDTLDSARFDGPVSVMLGIPRYAEKDLREFHGYPENANVLKQVGEIRQQSEDDVFATLEAIIKGEDRKLPVDLGYAIAQNPERLAAFAGGMAERFVALERTPGDASRERLAISAALATGMTALPRDSFDAISRRIFDVMRTPEGREEAVRWFPPLYIRAADAGPDTLSFYKAQFAANDFKPYDRALPALALCRIGAADAEVVAEMKRRYSEAGDDAAQGDGYRTALFVALMKFGEQDFLRANHNAASPETASWFEAVLANKGQTAAGPNNCMPEEWPFAAYLPSVMAPSLRYSRGQWNPRDGG